MLELPEVLARARELNRHVAGKTVQRVCPPSSPHKFCWFSGEPESYHVRLAGRTVESASGFGIYVEIAFSGGVFLCLNDGVNMRLFAAAETPPEKYQLLIGFSDGSALAFSVAMYGGILLHDGAMENPYYLASRQRVSPLSEDFTPETFAALIDSVRPSMSVKGLLATEQRIPGLGNGVLQDVLLAAGIHPKRKASSLSDGEKSRLFASIRETLSAMAAQGGRDTERDLFGRPGGYAVKMGKDALKTGCPVCGGEVKKENYMGGAIYCCAACQPLEQRG